MVTGESPKLSQITCSNEVPFLSHRGCHPSVKMAVYGGISGSVFATLCQSGPQLTLLPSCRDPKRKVSNSTLPQFISLPPFSCQFTMLPGINIESNKTLPVSSNIYHHLRATRWPVPSKGVLHPPSGTSHPSKICECTKWLTDLAFPLIISHNISQQYYTQITNPAVEWTFTRSEARVKQHSAMICGVSWSYNIDHHISSHRQGLLEAIHSSSKWLARLAARSAPGYSEWEWKSGVLKWLKIIVRPSFVNYIIAILRLTVDNCYYWHISYTVYICTTYNIHSKISKISKYASIICRVPRHRKLKFRIPRLFQLQKLLVPSAPNWGCSALRKWLEENRKHLWYIHKI